MKASPAAFMTPFLIEPTCNCNAVFVADAPTVPEFSGELFRVKFVRPGFQIFKFPLT